MSRQGLGFIEGDNKMGIRASRPHNLTAKQFLGTADKIAQSMGWKDHADALAHRDENGKVGRGPGQQEELEKMDQMVRDLNDIPEILRTFKEWGTMPYCIARVAEIVEKEGDFLRWVKVTPDKEPSKMACLSWRAVRGIC